MSGTTRACLLFGVAIAAISAVNCDAPTDSTLECWTALGPSAGPVYALARSDGGLLAGGEGHIWVRENSDWRTLLSGPWLVQDLLYLERGDAIVAATGPGIVDPFDPPTGPWFFMSRDGGEHWVALDDRLDSVLVVMPSRLLAGGGTPQAIVAATGPNIAISTDLGSSWRLAAGATGWGGGGNIASARSEDGQRLWLGGDDPFGDPRIVWSENGGADWTAIVRPAGASSRGISGLALHPTDPARVVAVTAGGVLHTTDGGTTWEWLYLSAPGLLYADLVGVGNRLYATAMVPSLTAPLEPLLLTSTDFGATWQAVPLPEDYPEAHGAMLPLGGSQLAVATSDGVWLFDPAAGPECLDASEPSQR